MLTDILLTRTPRPALPGSEHLQQLQHLSAQALLKLQLLHRDICGQGINCP